MTNEGASASPSGGLWVWVGRLIRLLLIVGILSSAAVVSIHWVRNPPRTERRPMRTLSTLVEVIPIRPEDTRVTVRGMGTVVPARSVQLAARVSGQVVSVSPQLEPGGLFHEADEVLRVDPEDYELALLRAEGELVRARSDVSLEMGQQSVARREYEILGQEVRPEEQELLLRRPQLQAREASVTIAEAAVERARLDLRRTSVRAPFNAVVRAKTIDVGSYVTPGAALATLVGTDEYWIEILLPMDHLQFVSLPDTEGEGGAPARVFHAAAWGERVWREGRVLRLLTDLEPQGRMARLLVSVADPLQMDAPHGDARPLILGAFVRVEIEGDELRGVVRIPRTALRDGGHVWLMQPDKTLAIREVSVAWSGPDYVYVRNGITEGELLVTSDLSAPVEGLPLRLADDPDDAAPRHDAPEAGQGQGQGAGQGRGPGAGGQRP